MSEAMRPVAAGRELVEPTAPRGAHLDPSSCITCSDALLEVLVRRVSDDGAWAEGTCAGEVCGISIELLAGVQVGDVVLVQGGVALQFREGGAR